MQYSLIFAQSKQQNHNINNKIQYILKHDAKFSHLQLLHFSVLTIAISIIKQSKANHPGGCPDNLGYGSYQFATTFSTLLSIFHLAYLRKILKYANNGPFGHLTIATSSIITVEHQKCQYHFLLSFSISFLLNIIFLNAFTMPHQ